jgi:N-acetylglucosaminyldiphosphoundecaprenol N-acetyl-beta-D-mannosaminyltransferase
MVDAAKAPEERVDILGVEVSAVDIDQVLAIVEDWVRKGERRYVCVTGVHGVMESQRDEELRRIHNGSGLTVPDGMPTVWAGRYAGAQEMDRVYGPEMMLAICERSAQHGWKSFFYGGARGTAELLEKKMLERFPEMQSAGTHTPPFRPLTTEEDEEVMATIEASGADLVWVGLSTPKQELWMAEHISRLKSPCILFGVGAAFDVNAGLRSDAPRWVKRLGLQWLHRLIQEPRRLWRRYLVNNPAFVAAVLKRPPKLVSQVSSETPK